MHTPIYRSTRLNTNYYAFAGLACLGPRGNISQRPRYSSATRVRLMENSDQHLFSFGVIADCQYGDDVDGANFDRTRIRYGFVLGVSRKVWCIG